MKKRCIIFLLFSLSFLIDGFAATSDNSELVQTLRAKIVDSPDSVLAKLDDIEAQNSQALPSFQINLLRSLAYNEKRMFSLVERYAMRALASDSISTHKKEYLNALTLLSVAQSYFGNYQGSIATSIKGMEMARQEGNKASEYNILTTMAKTSFTMGDHAKGYEYLDYIISEGSESSEVRVLANVSSAYGVKIVELYADDRFSEGLSEGKKRLELIDRIDKIGGSPAGFTDQQRAYAYARIASCAERLGNRDEASKAFDAFMATDYAKNPIGRVYIMDYLLDSGQWRKVLEFTAPLYPMFEGGDTINGDFHSLLISDGRAEAGLGNFRKAYGLIQRAAAIQDSLYIREKSTKAQELASIFAINEKDLALVNEKAKSQRKQILLLGSSGIALLILIILLLVWRAYRNSVWQQRIAAKRIDELIAQRPLEADATPENQKDYQQFADMQNKIISEGLFKLPNLNRDSIAEATGLSRAKVSQLIGRFTSLSPNEYINKLRVEYSVKQIKEHPEWTIDAIAESCGYVRRATYYSHFNKLFGISPAQYRKENSKTT
ncbi:MAG: helix-turn-helix domain-containing protein [Muribaculaceae bacterium]|nr:helix-turn-helix domain-containing protein [Muribaculaceae bacterium]